MEDALVFSSLNKPCILQAFHSPFQLHKQKPEQNLLIFYCIAFEMKTNQKS